MSTLNSFFYVGGGGSLPPKRARLVSTDVEMLTVHIQYSKPGIDMTAEGVVGGRRFVLESDSSFFRSDIAVDGVLGEDGFSLRGRTKNMRNRDFTVEGHWGDAPLRLDLRSKGRTFLVQGVLDTRRVSYEFYRSPSDELTVDIEGEGGSELRFRSAFGSVLDGKVEQHATAGIFAAFLPCFLRNRHGSIDSLGAPTRD